MVCGRSRRGRRIFATRREPSRSNAAQALNRDAERQASEIRVRAERKTGELLKVTKQSGERKGLGQPKKETSEAPTFLSAPDTLADLGISRELSSQGRSSRRHRKVLLA